MGIKERLEKKTKLAPGDAGKALKLFVIFISKCFHEEDFHKDRRDGIRKTELSKLFNSFRYAWNNFIRSLSESDTKNLPKIGFIQLPGDFGLGSAMFVNEEGKSVPYFIPDIYKILNDILEKIFIRYFDIIEKEKTTLYKPLLTSDKADDWLKENLPSTVKKHFDNLIKVYSRLSTEENVILGTHLDEKQTYEEVKHALNKWKKFFGDFLTLLEGQERIDEILNKVVVHGEQAFRKSVQNESLCGTTWSRISEIVGKEENLPQEILSFIGLPPQQTWDSVAVKKLQFPSVLAYVISISTIALLEARGVSIVCEKKGHLIGCTSNEDVWDTLKKLLAMTRNPPEGFTLSDLANLDKKIEGGIPYSIPKTLGDFKNMDLKSVGRLLGLFRKEVVRVTST